MSSEKTFSPLVQFSVYACRFFQILTLGLGLSSIPSGTEGSIILLVAIILIIRQRISAKKTLFFIPDGLLVCLPYFWSMNTTDVFQPWREWLIWIFLITFGFAITVIWDNWMGRPVWRTEGLGRGIFFSLLFVFLFASSLKIVFPLFSTLDFRKVILSGIFFFGGIPISQVTAIGILFPFPSKPSSK